MALAALGLLACSGSDEPSDPAPTAPAVGGQFASSGSGPFETVQFEEGGRYTATRSSKTETGSYAITSDSISFVDDVTHEATTMPYAANAPTSSPLISQSLTSGDSQVTSGQSQLTSKEVKLNGTDYALLTCQGGLGICSYGGCPPGRTRLGGGADCGWSAGPGKPFVQSGAGSCCSMTIGG